MVQNIPGKIQENFTQKFYSFPFPVTYGIEPVTLCLLVCDNGREIGCNHLWHNQYQAKKPQYSAVSLTSGLRQSALLMCVLFNAVGIGGGICSSVVVLWTVGIGGGIRSSVVACWTAGRQVERLILHQRHDS